MGTGSSKLPPTEAWFKMPDGCVVLRHWGDTSHEQYHAEGSGHPPGLYKGHDPNPSYLKAGEGPTPFGPVFHRGFPGGGGSRVGLPSMNQPMGQGSGFTPQSMNNPMPNPVLNPNFSNRASQAFASPSMNNPMSNPVLNPNASNRGSQAFGSRSMNNPMPNPLLNPNASNRGSQAMPNPMLNPNASNRASQAFVSPSMNMPNPRANASNRNSNRGSQFNSPSMAAGRSAQSRWAEVDAEAERANNELRAIARNIANDPNDNTGDTPTMRADQIRDSAARGGGSGSGNRGGRSGGGGRGAGGGASGAPVTRVPNAPGQQRQVGSQELRHINQPGGETARGERPRGEAGPTQNVGFGSRGTRKSQRGTRRSQQRSHRS